ncbi:MAG TPA: PDZ domain-containing protein [Longimicrobium sp.]|nr:PDZ domain-containing protein [Longimicrobium sp.]
MADRFPACAQGYDPADASRFHLGDMPAAERTRYDAHLDDCPSCRGAVARQAALDGALGGLPAYRAPETLARPPRAAWRPRRLGAAALAAAGAAALLLLPLLGPAPSQRMIADALAADAAVIAGRAAGGAGGATPWLGFATCADWIVPPGPGVYVCALDPAGPLARAGLHAGDVVLAIEGRPVESAAEMYGALLRHEVGDAVRVRVRQGGRERVVGARLAARPAAANPFDLEWSPALLASLDRVPPGGIDVDSVFIALDPAAAARMGVAGGVRVGLVPTRAQAAATLFSALPYLFGPEGLRAGDVIIAVQDEPVRDPGRLWMLLMDVQAVPFALRVVRDGRPIQLRFVPGT